MISKETEDRLFAFARAATPEEARRRVDLLREDVRERMRERIAELGGSPAQRSQPAQDEITA